MMSSVNEHVSKVWYSKPRDVSVQINIIINNNGLFCQVFVLCLAMSYMV